MYFELIINIETDFGIKRPDDMPEELIFITGSKITLPVTDPMVFTTKAESGDTIPDYWDGGVPIMSERFVKLIEDAGVDNIEKFPAIVKSINDSTIWSGYYAINIIGMVKCADLNKSTYTEIFPDNYDFEELAIVASKAHGALLFRLQESPSTIIIHKSVGKHILKNDPDEELIGWDVKEIIQ